MPRYQIAHVTCARNTTYLLQNASVRGGLASRTSVVLLPSGSLVCQRCPSGGPCPHTAYVEAVRTERPAQP